MSGQGKKILFSVFLKLNKMLSGTDSSRSDEHDPIWEWRRLIYCIHPLNFNISSVLFFLLSIFSSFTKHISFTYSLLSSYLQINCIVFSQDLTARLTDSYFQPILNVAEMVSSLVLHDFLHPCSITQLSSVMSESFLIKYPFS